MARSTGSLSRRPVRQGWTLVEIDLRPFDPRSGQAKKAQDEANLASQSTTKLENLRQQTDTQPSTVAQ
jgi:multidrug resistance efflux pump